MKMFDIRDHRRGLNAYLGYAAFVDDGIIIQKNGSFLAGFSYVGPDLDTAIPDDIIRLQNATNNAFLTLGDNYVVHVNAIRRDASGYPEAGFFPDRTTWLIDEERRKMALQGGIMYDSIYVATIAWAPPSELLNKAENFIFSDSKESVPAKTRLNKLLLEFKDTLSAFEAMLKGGDIAVRRLGSQELLTFIHSCVTGLPHPLRVPSGIRPWLDRFIDEPANEKTPPPLFTFLDTVVASQDFVGGFSPKIGDMNIGVLAITGLPTETTPGMLDLLNRVSSGFRWNTRFISMGPSQAGQQLGKLTQAWNRKQFSFMQVLKASIGKGTPKPRQETVEKLQQLEVLRGANSDGKVRFGYYNTEIIMYHENKNTLEDELRFVKSEVERLGFGCRIEKENAVRAYLGSLPGDGYNNIRRIFFASQNLVDLLPLTSLWGGMATNRHFGGAPALLHTVSLSGTPFRLNLHVRDVGHTLVIGPTGRGKSTLLMLLAMQFFRYKDAQVVVFDKGYSALKPCLATGGIHYDIMSPDNPEALSLCPLKYIADSEADFVWGVEFVADICRLQLSGTTEEFGPEQVKAIREALEILKHDDDKSLSALHGLVQDKIIRMSLEPYTKMGAALLNAQQDNIQESRFVTFETEHLLKMGDKLVVPTLEYLFRVVEKRLTGKPTLIVLDEAWSLLKNPLFEERIKEWLKVLRKANASVIFATQSLEDVAGSNISAALFESCPTKILLGNPHARTASRELYEKIGLNPVEIAALADAPQYSYYYTSELGKRMFQLRLGPSQAAFVAGAGPENTIKVRECISKYGDSWPFYWLKEYSSLPAAADAWAQAVPLG